MQPSASQPSAPHAASAEDLTWLQQLSKFRFTVPVEGTVTFQASSAAGPLAGMTCADVVVGASSNATKGSGLGTAPAWVRTTTATGNFATGSCRYALPVPAGQAFTLTAWGAGKFDCSVIQSTAAPTAAVTVTSNTTKTVNVDARSFRCDQLQ